MTPNQIAEKWTKEAYGIIGQFGVVHDPCLVGGKTAISAMMEHAITEALEEKDDMLAYHKAEEEHAKDQLTASQERERKLREALRVISAGKLPTQSGYYSENAGDDVHEQIDEVESDLVLCRTTAIEALR